MGLAGEVGRPQLPRFRAESAAGHPGNEGVPPGNEGVPPPGGFAGSAFFGLTRAARSRLIERKLSPGVT